MGSTYYSLHYHWVCSTKERRPFLHSSWRGRLHQYLGGAIRGLDGMPLRIGGIEDHVHVLLGLKPIHCIADFTRELKKASSVWAFVHEEPAFEWQEGYSIFSVSVSMIDQVSHYIDDQEKHHGRHDFVEELKTLLAKHQVSYDPKFLL